MAIVTGPLRSDDARGKFGSQVFTAWKGRKVVRTLAIPSNPRTAGQQASRNIVKVSGRIQAHVLRDQKIREGQTKRDEELFRAFAPSGQSWNGYILQLVAGPSQVNYDAASTAWAAVVKPAWETAATALAPPYAAIVAQVQPNAAPVTISPGEVFFRHQYAMYTAGILNTAPTTPPTYT